LPKFGQDVFLPLYKWPALIFVISLHEKEVLVGATHVVLVDLDEVNDGKVLREIIKENIF